MTTAREDRLREIYSAWNRGDYGWEFFTADVEWDATHWAPDMPEVAQGTKNAEALINRFMGTWDKVRFEPERFIEKGDSVVVLLEVHGHGRASGVPFVDQTAHIFTFSDDLICRMAHFRDREEALEAVGLSE